MLRLTEQQLRAIQALCRQYQVTRLELFGSAAREDFDAARSDVDLLVEFAPGTDFGPWMARFSDLQDQLEALLERNLPKGLCRQVERVTCKRAHAPTSQRLYNNWCK